MRFIKKYLTKNVVGPVVASMLEEVTRPITSNQQENAKHLQQLVTDQGESLSKRVEFIRAELIYELRYGLKQTHRDSKAQADTSILNQAKVDSAKSLGHVALNLGCGHKPLSQYINIDMRKLPGVDVVATVTDLPFEPGSIDEIFTSHVLEHFPQEQLRRQILPYWREMLKPNGALRIIVPDAGKMLSEYSSGSLDFETLREVTFGSQDYDGDFHYTMFTIESLKIILDEAGFKNFNCVEAGRRNGLCFEMEITAD